MFNYEYWVYVTKNDGEYRNDDFIFAKLICSQHSVAQFTEMLNKSFEYAISKRKAYFMRKSEKPIDF